VNKCPTEGQKARCDVEGPRVDEWLGRAYDPVFYLKPAQFSHKNIASNNLLRNCILINVLLIGTQLVLDQPRTNLILIDPILMCMNCGANLTVFKVDLELPKGF
jgi:hypothetical protein